MEKWGEMAKGATQKKRMDLYNLKMTVKDWLNSLNSPLVH